MKPLLLTKQAQELYNKIQEIIKKEEEKRQELIKKYKKL